VPTLVITGDEDRVYPLELTRRMAQRIPGAELVVLEGCGHLSNLEQPEQFNAALLDFLTRNS
jgi:pimeloyl-ACP methyl ester carboxylesterase